MVAGMCIANLTLAFGTIAETNSALVSCIRISKSFTCFIHDSHMYMQDTVYLYLRHVFSTFAGIVCLSGEGNCLVANDSGRVMICACCDHAYAKVSEAW